MLIRFAFKFSETKWVFTRPGRALSALFLIVGMIFFSGCRDRSQTEVTEVVEFSEVLPFETVGIGQRSDFADPVERMIYNDDIWVSVASALRPHVPFESVDFSQVMLALIATPTESGGYSVEVESVELLNGIITVSYLIGEPGFDCITPQALAVPFQVIEIRKIEGTVVFERRTERYSCEDF